MRRTVGLGSAIALAISSVGLASPDARAASDQATRVELAQKSTPKAKTPPDRAPEDPPLVSDEEIPPGADGDLPESELADAPPPEDVAAGALARKDDGRNPTDADVARGTWTLERFRPAGPAATSLVVASAFDGDGTLDLHFSLDMIYEAHAATLLREHVRQTPPASPGDPVPIVRDLASSQTRQLLVPRVAVGVFRDLELSLALPVVISDVRSISRDLPSATSPTVGDGIIGADGFDAATGAPIGAGSSTLFRGVKRSGLDQLYLGSTYAITNQARDPAKPMWTVGLELRLSIGSIQRFDRQDPGGSTGVSNGVHELRAHTAFARRIGALEPRGEVWWLGPVGLRGDDPDDPAGSLYWKTGFGQEAFGPRHRAGVAMGLGLHVWDRPLTRRALVIDLDLKGEQWFEGRGYSEMWELLAYAGDVTAAGPLVLDLDPTTAGVQELDHPGVTNIENFLRLGARVGATLDLGRLRLQASFSYAKDTRHHVTWTDAGKDGDDPDDFITPNTSENNPLHQPVIDLVGRRYIAEGASTMQLALAAMFLF